MHSYQRFKLMLISPTDALSPSRSQTSTLHVVKLQQSSARLPAAARYEQVNRHSELSPEHRALKLQRKGKRRARRGGVFLPVYITTVPVIGKYRVVV